AARRRARDRSATTAGGLVALLPLVLQETPRRVRGPRRRPPSPVGRGRALAAGAVGTRRAGGPGAAVLRPAAEDPQQRVDRRRGRLLRREGVERGDRLPELRDVDGAVVAPGDVRLEARAVAPRQRVVEIVRHELDQLGAGQARTSAAPDHQEPSPMGPYTLRARNASNTCGTIRPWPPSALPLRPTCASPRSPPRGARSRRASPPARGWSAARCATGATSCSASSAGSTPTSSGARRSGSRSCIRGPTGSAPGATRSPGGPSASTPPRASWHPPRPA